MTLTQAPEAQSPFSTLTEWFGGAVGIPLDIQRRIVVSIVILAGLWFLRRLVLRVVRRRLDRPQSLYQWAKLSSYITTLVAILVIGPIWLEGIGSIGTFLGLLTAGLAIALREPVANLAGWGYVVWRRPFEVGDRVQIGTVSGDVVDVGLFQFTLLEIGNWVDADQSTGRVIHVPNSRLFTQPIANSTADFPYIWNEVPVLITFESDWRLARSLIESIVNDVGGIAEDEVRRSMKRASEKFLIFYRNITPIVYVSVRDSGILLTARYLCDPRARRGTSEGIWTRLLDAFDDNDAVELAYPTMRITGMDGAEA